MSAAPSQPQRMHHAPQPSLAPPSSSFTLDLSGHPPRRPGSTQPRHAPPIRLEPALSSSLAPDVLARPPAAWFQPPSLHTTTTPGQQLPSPSSGGPPQQLPSPASHVPSPALSASAAEHPPSFCHYHHPYQPQPTHLTGAPYSSVPASSDWPGSQASEVPCHTQGGEAGWNASDSCEARAGTCGPQAGASFPQVPLGLMPEGDGDLDYLLMLIDGYDGEEGAHFTTSPPQQQYQQHQLYEHQTAAGGVFPDCFLQDDEEDLDISLFDL
jgi:hypothetical protein